MGAAIATTAGADSPAKRVATRGPREASLREVSDGLRHVATTDAP